MRTPTRTRSTGSLVAAGFLLAAGVASTACGAGSERRFASIGTAGTGGIYYPLGGALARMLGEAVPGVSFTAEVTGGSVENLNRVAAGQIDLGMAIGTTLALSATGPDAASYRQLRVVAPLYPNVAHVLVAPRAELESLAQAAGARVSLGAAGSGTEQMARDVLAAYGLDETDIQQRYLSFNESSSALADGALEAAILSVGYPASAVLEATTTSGVRLLGLDPGPLAALIEAHPYYRASVIPAGAYPGLERDVPTVAVMNWIFATTQLPDEIASALLDVLRDRRDELAAVSEIARRIELDALERAPLPLHPATVAWLARRPGEASAR